MDLTRMIAPKSDQKNADDFIGGPQTFTITAEIEYDDEQQPAGLVLDDDTAHPYKPGKSMGRVLTAAWGKGSYVGHRLTLYNDPTVRFGNQETGGIRISHMSHITKPLKLNLTQKKGSKAYFTVQPLADAPTAPAPIDVATITDREQLASMWQHAPRDSAERAAIEARVAELKAAETGDPA